jgi:hypothetical protein
MKEPRDVEALPTKARQPGPRNLALGGRGSRGQHRCYRPVRLSQSGEQRTHLPRPLSGGARCPGAHHHRCDGHRPLPKSWPGAQRSAGCPPVLSSHAWTSGRWGPDWWQLWGVPRLPRVSPASRRPGRSCAPKRLPASHEPGRRPGCSWNMDSLARLRRRRAIRPFPCPCEPLSCAWLGRCHVRGKAKRRSRHEERVDVC